MAEVIFASIIEGGALYWLVVLLWAYLGAQLFTRHCAGVERVAKAQLRRDPRQAGRQCADLGKSCRRRSRLRVQARHGRHRAYA